MKIFILLEFKYSVQKYPLICYSYNNNIAREENTFYCSCQIETLVFQDPPSRCNLLCKVW